MNRIITNGYGSSFTNIITNGDTVIKESINSYGNFKTSNEISFYKHIVSKHYNWNIPIIYNLEDSKIIMKYYKDYMPLYSVINKLSHEKQEYIISNIFLSLSVLHSFESITLQRDDFVKHIKTETYSKLINRLKDINDILNKYHFIKKINSVELLSFDTLLYHINNYIDNYIQQLTEYKFTIIHGDPQFSNILYNINTNDIVFIDPRGYFGDMSIYGLPEYDIAKVYFAISGYDTFDKFESIKLNINNDNMIIDPISINLNFLTKVDIISVLVVSIWLGNAHAFKNNPEKAVLSHYYARYLGTLLFR